MPRPCLVVCAGEELFASFFSVPLQRRLSRLFRWERVGTGKSVELKQRLATAEALVTTWDSPRFDNNLQQLASRLRMITHWGGEK